jgi:hypothetical protein
MYTLRRKRDELGRIIRYKAQIVAKGYKQRFGIDYTETYAPTVRPATLRILLSLVAQHDAIIHQADVKNTYLNAPLQNDEVIYMQLPPKYLKHRKLPPEVVNKRTVTCKLLKPLYSTKQGARHWYAKLKKIFLNYNYSVSHADEAVFYKFNDDKYVIVAAATDDFTIIGDSINSVATVKEQLTNHFEIVDLGEIKWLLRISISRDLKSKTISLGQQEYVKQIISRFDLQDARPAVTPMEPGVDLSPDSLSTSPILLTESEKRKYREMISSLMYASIMMRPDIAFAVSTLSQFLETPRTTHLNVVAHIFRYLLGIKHLKLIIGGDHSGLTGYSDADWASNSHRHSISGFAYFLGSGPVSWSLKKQPIITLSSTEVEYVALMHALKDILWIHKLLSELSPIFPFKIPSLLLCNNQGAIRLSKNSTFHGRTKHIDIHFHFIRQTILSGDVALQYCPTEHMIADTFTKSLAQNKFKNLRSNLNIL